MTFTETQRELRREHRARLDSARVLVDLEEQAFHADLPVLEWQINAFGLSGRPPVFGLSPAKTRAAFQAWAAHLDAPPEPPIQRAYPSQSEVLRAETRVPHPRSSTGTVRVILIAEIGLEEEEDPCTTPPR